MNEDRRTEIAASVAAHRDLGPGYDSAVAEGLVDRIGEEIDRRVDARLGKPAKPDPPAHPAKPPGSVAGVFMTLGSIALGVGATAVATSLGKNAAAQVIMVLLIWGAIAIVNISHSRKRLCSSGSPTGPGESWYSRRKRPGC
jgi:hypothetical protein